MTAASKDREFRNHANTQEEEDDFDYIPLREGINPTGLVGAIAHIVKGALGGGILSGPVAYTKAGVLTAVPLNIIFGIYMGYCMHLLVHCCQILLRRTRKPFLSYADVGEAAMKLFPKQSIAKHAYIFRYMIDTTICLDLFGSCCTYQIIVAKSLKQLVENTSKTSLYGKPGYPALRLYLAIMMPFFVLICLITRLKYLVPFSLAANGVVFMAIIMTIYYCATYNPRFEGMTMTTSFEGTLQFVGMSVFAMSCAGVVIPIESNMRNPKKFSTALLIGQGTIIFCVVATSFFGYAAFREEAEAPFTINFPMTTVPMIFKALICVMIYITHALNFWVPFNLCWYYLKKNFSETRILMWERICRAIFVMCIACVAIIFPTITGLMGFIGCFCLSNMALIYPSIISILVLYERPGLGRFHWRLWRALFFIVIGLFVLMCGSVVNMKALLSVFA